ncbi:unnamed protein product [Haemonchus placei]|uniref:Reverse transcriptase domain-containing protein n=1 Tax=Haemonchus placei TaxID=6290 RepID=A0A0N4X8T9_HAEPC|nr:unnamed protein product [Haemonchus placei]
MEWKECGGEILGPESTFNLEGADAGGFLYNALLMLRAVAIAPVPRRHLSKKIARRAYVDDIMVEVREGNPSIWRRPGDCNYDTADNGDRQRIDVSETSGKLVRKSLIKLRQKCKASNIKGVEAVEMLRRKQN